MKKKLFKAVAASAAVCFMAGIVLFNGGTDSKAAPGDYVVNYDFNNGELGDVKGNDCTVEIIGGMNSNYDALIKDPSAPADTDGSCVKISKRKEYWETSAFRYDLGNLVDGTKYTISYDVYHENGETDKYSSNRVVILHYQPDWGQYGQPMPAPMGEWERVTIDFEYKAPADTKDHYIYIEFAYPEATDKNENKAYKDNNLEEYYIDNFSIKEYVEPTAKPTEAPTPTPAASTPAPTTAPVVTEAPIVVPTDDGKSGFDAGYEETIKGITYIVNADDTVTVAGIESAKSKLVIPNTVTFEDGSVFNVTAIKANAFKGETAIKNLTIGSNITSIGKNAFAKCKNIKKVTIKSSAVKTIGKGAFKTIKKKATISVPKAKKAAYKKLLKKSGLPKGAKVK